MVVKGGHAGGVTAAELDDRERKREEKITTKRVYFWYTANIGGGL